MTENNPSLNETTDQPKLTSPGSIHNSLRSIIERNAQKSSCKVEDYQFCVCGITYKDGEVVPCMLEEEAAGDDSVKVYQTVDELGDRLEFFKSQMDNPSFTQRKIIGVFHVQLRLPERVGSCAWYSEQLGPKRVDGFI